jgi:hypothetical protein
MYKNLELHKLTLEENNLAPFVSVRSKTYEHMTDKADNVPRSS